MTVGAYTAGAAVLAIVAVAAGAGGRLLRRRFLPDRAGADAALAAAVLALFLVLTVSQVLGTVGLFRPWIVAGALVAVWAAAEARGRRLATADGGAGAPPSAVTTERDRSLPTLAAVATSAIALAQWVPHVAASYGRGILDGDTLWYHGPFAARFARTGWLTRLHFTNAEALTTYFPANAEVVHALGVGAFSNDLLSPAVNLGWLALALLGAWCVGRDAGAGAAALAAVAAVLTFPVMAATQAGTGRNDAAAVALFLAALALLGQARRSGDVAGAVVAGGAAGLALGVKIGMLGPGAALTVGAIVGLRGRARWGWLAAFATAGSFWFLRNLFRVGNPLPYLGIDLGPLQLEAAPLEAPVTGAALAAHLGDPGVWQDVLRPGLENALGPLWPIVVVAAGGGIVAAARRERTRVLALVVGLAAAAYIVTPNSAAGAGTTVTLFRENFSLNLRYIVPALAGAVALLAASGGRRTRAAIGLGALAVAVANQFPRRLTRIWEWRVEPGDSAWGVVAAAVLVGGFAVMWRLGGGRRALGSAAVLAAVATALLGWPLQRHYTDGRYRNTAALPVAAAPLYPWAQDLRSTSIGIYGDFLQYPFYGDDLSNDVQYVGRRRPHGGFRAPRSCEEWRAALAAGRYDLVVLVPPLFPGGSELERALAWTATDPAASRVEVPAGAAFRFSHGDKGAPPVVTSVGCR